MSHTEVERILNRYKSGAAVERKSFLICIFKGTLGRVMVFFQMSKFPEPSVKEN